MSDMPEADRPAVGRTARARAPAAPPTSLRQGYGGPPKHPRRRKRIRRDGGRLDVRVSDEHGRAVRAAGLGAWLARLAPARARGLVSVALVSDRRVRALNRTYRRQDDSTDVLSFPAFARMDNARASARQARRPVRPDETHVPARQAANSTPAVPSPQSPRLRSSAIHRATAGPSDQPPPRLRRSAEASAKARRRAASSPLEDRFAIDLTGYRHAEEFQHRWRDIGNVCAFDAERPARNEGARCFLVVV